METTDPHAQLYHLPRGAAESNLPSCSHGTGRNVVTRQHSRKSSLNPKMEDSTSVPFHANPPFSKGPPLLSLPPSLPRIVYLKRSFLINVGIGTIPFTKVLPFCTSPLCFQPIKAAKQSQPQVSSGDLPFLFAASLVLEHKLNKICLEISLKFPLDFYLGEPKGPKCW